MAEPFLQLPPRGEFGRGTPIAIMVDASEVTNFHPRYRQNILAEFGAAQKKANVLILTTLIPLIPEYEGKALGSLKPLPTVVTPYGSEGGIGSDLDYMGNLEFGRDPGTWPPVKNLEAWAQRKFGRRGAGFAVARKIKEQGIPGKFMWQETYEKVDAPIQAMFDSAVERAIAKS